MHNKSKRKTLFGDQAGRTVREFESDLDVWSMAAQWSEERGYKKVKSDPGTATFCRRDRTDWFTPMMVSISTSTKGYRLEAWIKRGVIDDIVPFLTVALSFFTPSELKIDSGGRFEPGLRRWAREDVNVLLEALDVPVVT